MARMTKKQQRENEELVREWFDNAVEMIDEGLVDDYLIELGQRIQTRAQVLTKHDYQTQQAQKQQETVSASNGEKKKSAPMPTRKGKGKKEQVFTVSRSKKLRGATVKVLSKSKNNSEASNVEVVTGNDNYETGAQFQVKTDRLVESA